MISLVAFTAPSQLHCQLSAGDTLPQGRQRLAGRVLRAVGGGLEPVAGLRLTLHRVGSDRAGALDSSRTSTGGRYSFLYRPSGSADAIYFVSVSYDGIVYLSSPTRGESLIGQDANITVFDTTSGPVPIRVAGHHFVVTAARPDGRREVAEVYDLSNDSSVTKVSRGDRAPTWAAHVPGGGTDFRVGGGDIGSGAVTFTNGSALVFAPLSPGIRQFAFKYVLSNAAFPLSVPVERPTTILEVLLEEPTAQVSGASLAELAPVSSDGRTFKRYLSHDVPSNVVIRVHVPEPVATISGRYLTSVLGLGASIMVVALTITLRRKRPHDLAPEGAPLVAPDPGAGSDEKNALVREIALLDARFEEVGAPTTADRAAYERQRAELKAHLGAVLASARPPA